MARVLLEISRFWCHGRAYCEVAHTLRALVIESGELVFRGHLPRQTDGRVPRWLIVDRDLWQRLPRIISAVVVMGFVLVGLKSLLMAHFDLTGSSIGRISSLALLVAAGLAVYVVCLQLFGVARLKELIAAIRHGL